MATVTFYSKPNCPLCDEALEQIELARREVWFEFVEVNILRDPHIYELYKHTIPVVVVDGEEWFRYCVSAEALVARLLSLEA